MSAELDSMLSVGSVAKTVKTVQELELALSMEPNLIVFFTAPWCDRCKQSLPEVEKTGIPTYAIDLHEDALDGEVLSEYMREHYEVSASSLPTMVCFVQMAPPVVLTGTAKGLGERITEIFKAITT